MNGFLNTDESPEDSDVEHLQSKSYDNQEKEQPEKVGHVRYTLAYMGFLGFFLIYAMRINISVALVDMVEQKPESNSVNDNCPVDKDNITSYHPGFDWSNEEQSDVLGAFYYGYLLTQIPGGIIATKLGGKFIFGLGVLSTGIFTLITPPAAHLGVYWLIVIRAVEGVMEAVTFPAFNVLLGAWSPKLERSFFSAFSVSGGTFGNVLIQPLVGYLCDLKLWDGWPLGFYSTGIVTIIWFVAWVFLVYETPRKHPRICENEIRYIETNIAPDDRPRVIPWRSLLTSRPLYGLLIAHVCCNWTNYGIMSCLPQYLSNVLNFDITSNGFISAAPWLFCWIAIQLFSYVTDIIRTRTLISTTTLRKANQLIGTVLPGTFLVLAGYAGCNSTLAVTLIIVGMFFFGANFSGYMCNNLDLAPQYAGVLFGITNTFATIPGFVAPKVVALMTDSDVHSAILWRKVFFVFAGVGLFGGLAFLILGSGERQKWAMDGLNLDGEGPLLIDESPNHINCSDSESEGT